MPPEVARSEASRRKFFLRECAKREVVCLKAEHMDPGFPDEMLLCGSMDVVFVELKTAIGKLRANQKHWHKRLRRMGYRVEVLKTRNAQLSFLDEQYGLPEDEMPGVELVVVE